jgi:hypothetical protein
MTAGATEPELAPHARRYYEAIDRLRAETAQAEELIGRLHGATANLRQQTLEGRLHMDGETTKALADLVGPYHAALVLSRLADDLTKQLAAAEVA